MAKSEIAYGDQAVASQGEAGNRVFFSMGKTVNIGKYETIRVDVGESRVVPDGAKFSKFRKAVQRNVKKMLSEVVNMIEEQVDDA